uniref:Aa_trans domain-containing protein n=1 Tax=Trichuris muris TaxID=70415 RepID=A0A5S6QF40_TRIMR
MRSSGSYSPWLAQYAADRQQTLGPDNRNDLSLSKATTALLRSMLGPVLFTFPALYQKTGFLVGLLLTIASASWSTCTMIMIARACEWMCQACGKETGVTYGHLCVSALKRTSYCRDATCERLSYALNYAVAVFQIGICCFQVKFMTTHAAYLAKMTNCSFCGEKSYCHLAVIPCTCVVGAVANVTILAWMALLANGLVATVIVAVFREAVSKADIQFPSLDVQANFGTICKVLGAVIFAFEGQTLILPLRNRMLQPQQLASPIGVVPLSMLIITTVFITAGSVGFIALKEQAPESILLSDQVITHSWVQAAVIAVMLFAVMASYPFNLLAVVDILEEPWKATLQRWGENVQKLPLTFLLRLLLSLLVGALTIGIPDLESITSFLGGSVGMLVCFVVPPLTLLMVELESVTMSVLKRRLLTALRITQSLIGIAVACFTLTANFAH